MNQQQQIGAESRTEKKRRVIRYEYDLKFKSWLSKPRYRSFRNMFTERNVQNWVWGLRLLTRDGSFSANHLLIFLEREATWKIKLFFDREREENEPDAWPVATHENL